MTRQKNQLDVIHMILVMEYTSLPQVQTDSHLERKSQMRHVSGAKPLVLIPLFNASLKVTSGLHLTWL